MFISNNTVKGVRRCQRASLKCHIGKSLNGQMDYLILLFFSEGSVIMAEAIAMIPTRRSSNIHEVVHSYKSVCKEMEVFDGDLLALLSERLPLHAIFIYNY